MDTYELRYSTGGHGGPYHGTDSAVRAAVRLLRGNENESWVDVYPRAEIGRWDTRERVFRAERKQYCRECGHVC